MWEKNRYEIIVKRFCFIFAFLIFLSSHAQSAQTGKISGVIVDAETGGNLVMANCVLLNTQFGSASDLNGKFVIETKPGVYTLRVSYVGYQTQDIENITVSPNTVTVVDVLLKPQALGLEAVTVTAKAIRNTEASMLKDRQKSRSLSDAISAEAISRSGSGNAAEAMKMVTGASVVDGKYVFVRGLGDRYTSTQLNGAEMPSTDPYKRGGSIDLIPGSLMDNIVTIKSFTPDKPGNFSGGTVNIKTRDFPELLHLTFSSSYSMNSQTTYQNEGPIASVTGEWDWLAMGSKTRTIPELLQDKASAAIPSTGKAGTDSEAAQKLDQYSKAFSSDMRPVSFRPPVNQQYAFSAGNQFDLFGRSLGYLASFTYSRSYSSYNNGRLNRWNLGSSTQNYLAGDFSLDDTKTADEVHWGGLVKVSYKFDPKNIFHVNWLFNRNGESVSRMLEGYYPYDLGENDVFQTSVISYKERFLQNLQLSGEHHFSALAASKLDWKVSYSSSTQDEPDQRFFTNFYRDLNDGNRFYGIKQNVPPSRYWRYTDQNNREVTVDYDVPFKSWTKTQGAIKIGGLYSAKERYYNERLFFFSQSPAYQYNGDPAELFSPYNVGLTDTTTRVINGTTYERYNFGMVVLESNTPASTYTGEENISAGYLMLDLPLTKKLRFVGGARYENTVMDVVTADSTKPEGHINTGDWLPSANFIYSFTEKMNVRFAYSKTLARPNFREIAPYTTYDFMGGDSYLGNAFLKRTLIENIDLRWEWFQRSGEIFAMSVFYKHFTNPIEIAIINLNHVLMWKNVPSAELMGLEFEARKQLDWIHSSLKNFQIGGNFSLVESRVDISDEELIMIRETRPDAPETRPFAGQSPYLLNLNLSYDDLERGISASVYYNVFGERLSEVSLGGTPDVYEKSAPLLNASASYRLTPKLQIKLSGKNILNSDLLKVQRHQGDEYIYHSFRKGVSFSIGLQYKI